MNFGQALEALKLGSKVRRDVWKGKSMWLNLDNDRTEDDTTLPFIVLNYPSGNVPSDKPECAVTAASEYPMGARVPWVASHTDILSGDWRIVIVTDSEKITVEQTLKYEELKVANQDGLNDAQCPLPLSVIPNHMGINLCNVYSVTWVKQGDEQLVSLTIDFNPEPNETPNVGDE